MSQPITVLDSVNGVISVPAPFPETNVISWLLQSQPACVNVVPDGYQVDSDLLLVTGKHLLVQPVCMNQMRFTGVCLNFRLHVGQSMQMCHTANGIGSKPLAAAHLPRGQISLPLLSISDWRRVVHSFKTTAATGPCGWSCADMLNMTDQMRINMCKRFWIFSPLLRGEQLGHSN